MGKKGNIRVMIEDHFSGAVCPQIGDIVTQEKDSLKLRLNLT